MSVHDLERFVDLGGEGNYWTIAFCAGDSDLPQYRGVAGSVMRHNYVADANRAKDQIDDTGCGGCCRRDHAVVDISEYADGLPLWLQS